MWSSYAFSDSSVSISYESQQPIISNVTGCRSDSTNATSGCTEGTWITVWGSHFVLFNQLQVVDSSTGTDYRCAQRNLTSTRLIAQLPDVPKQLWYQPLGLQMRSNGLLSKMFPLSYAMPPPRVERVIGCPISGPGNGTSGCSGGQILTIIGTFSAGNISVSIDSHSCSLPTRLSDTVISCVLPYIKTEGGTFSVQVSVGDLLSNLLSPLSYNSQRPVIVRATGCAFNDSTDNTTSGCVAGQTVTFSGNHLFNISNNPPGIAIGVSYWSCVSIQWLSNSAMTCVLPSIPSAPPTELRRVTVWNGLFYNNPIHLLRYASPSPTSTPFPSSSSSSSQPVHPRSSSSSLFSSAIPLLVSSSGSREPDSGRAGGIKFAPLAVVLVVVVVSALLLIAFALYRCRHELSTGQLSCCCRTGGKKRVIPSQDIRLGLVTHDYQRHAAVGNTDPI